MDRLVVVRLIVSIVLTLRTGQPHVVHVISHFGVNQLLFYRLSYLVQLSVGQDGKDAAQIKLKVLNIQQSFN